MKCPPPAVLSASQFFLAPRAFVDDLMPAVIGHLLPLSRLGKRAQASGAEAGLAVELA